MTRLPWALSALAYLLVTRVMTSPLIDFVRLRNTSYESDSRLLIWTLAWDSHALLNGTALFDANMFYPATGALAWAEHHIGLGLFALPVYALTHNPVYAYWVVWLLAFPLNALAMQALAYRVTRDHVASFGAGLIYAFCFFRMHHAHAHVQMLWTWALPLALLALDRWVTRPTIAATAAVTGFVLLQTLSGWYLAVMTALLLVPGALFLLPGRRLTWRHVATGGPALLLAVGIVAWFAAPYTRLPGNAAAEVSGNSADLASYLVPPENTWLGDWTRVHTSFTPRWIWGEQTLYAGGITLVLGLAGLLVWLRRTDRVTAAVLASGVIALALSLGPGAGHSPFDLFSSLPAMDLLRAPARLALLVMLALALLAAIGAARLRAWAPRTATVALAVLALAGLAESFVTNFPGGKPPVMKIPEIYLELNRLPPGPVLSLPTYRFALDNFHEADYLLFSTAHWNPIVNGFGRHEPPGHMERMAVLSTFPSSAAVSLLQRIGVRYVVLHTGRATELREAAKRAGEHPALKETARIGEDVLISVTPAASVPPS